MENTNFKDGQNVSGKKENVFNRSINYVKDIYKDNAMCDNKKIHQRVKNYKIVEIVFIIFLFISPLFIYMIFSNVDYTLIWKTPTQGGILLNKPIQQIAVGIDKNGNMTYGINSNITLLNEVGRNFLICNETEFEMISTLNESELFMYAFIIETTYFAPYSFTSKYINDNYPNFMRIYNQTITKVSFAAALIYDSIKFAFPTTEYFIPISLLTFAFGSGYDSDLKFGIPAMDLNFKYHPNDFKLQSGTTYYYTNHINYNYINSEVFSSFFGVDQSPPTIPFELPKQWAFTINGTITHDFFANIFTSPN